MIKNPYKPSAKMVNIENQVSQVMTMVLQSNEISRLLFEMGFKYDKDNDLFRKKILSAIIFAFEQIYLHQSTPVINEIRKAVFSANKIN